MRCRKSQSSSSVGMREMPLMMMYPSPLVVYLSPFPSRLCTCPLSPAVVCSLYFHTFVQSDTEYYRLGVCAFLFLDVQQVLIKGHTFSTCIYLFGARQGGNSCALSNNMPERFETGQWHG